MTPRVFRMRGATEISFGRGVALTSTCVHQSLVRKSLWWTVCACFFFVHRCIHFAFMCVCVLKKAERWRKRRELIKNRCLGFLCLRFWAGDERQRRWRCGCRCLNLYLSVSLHSGGTAVSLLWVSAASSIVPVTSQKNSGAVKAAWCQVGWSEQTYASLGKNPDESAYWCHKLEGYNRLLGVCV